WAPWLWELQRYGGYAAVAKNHAGYFTGLGEWWENAVRQAFAMAHDERLLTKLSPVMALLLALAMWTQRRASASRSDGLAQGVSGGRDPQASASTLSERTLRAAGELSSWMAAAWLIGLSVAVPLSTPYPRLALPWLLGSVVAL